MVSFFRSFRFLGLILLATTVVLAGCSWGDASDDPETSSLFDRLQEVSEFTSGDMRLAVNVDAVGGEESFGAQIEMAGYVGGTEDAPTIDATFDMSMSGEGETFTMVMDLISDGEGIFANVGFVEGEGEPVKMLQDGKYLYLSERFMETLDEIEGEEQLSDEDFDQLFSEIDDQMGEVLQQLAEYLEVASEDGEKYTARLSVEDLGRLLESISSILEEGLAEVGDEAGGSPLDALGSLEELSGTDVFIDELNDYIDGDEIVVNFDFSNGMKMDTSVSMTDEEMSGTLSFDFEIFNMGVERAVAIPSEEDYVTMDLLFLDILSPEPRFINPEVYEMMGIDPSMLGSDGLEWGATGDVQGFDAL